MSEKDFETAVSAFTAKMMLETRADHAYARSFCQSFANIIRSTLEHNVVVQNVQRMGNVEIKETIYGEEDFRLPARDEGWVHRPYRGFNIYEVDGDYMGKKFEAAASGRASIYADDLAELKAEIDKVLDAKRETFEVPDGYYAVRDAEGRATGEIRQISEQDDTVHDAEPSQTIGEALEIKHEREARGCPQCGFFHPPDGMCI